METYEAMAALADELAAHGLRHVCISPGSRSTPLALTFARHPDVHHHVHHDERSAAFFALGIGKTTGTPAAVITTSGTAAAELFPAAVEARFGRVPLLLLTADRPPRLRGTGANQTIDQVNLFGTNVKWFEDSALAGVTDSAQLRANAARAWSETMTAPAGPVHINVPLDEPLTPHGPIRFGPSARTTSWTAPAAVPDERSLRELADMAMNREGVILAGPTLDSGAAPALADLARATGFPVLADPLSGLRRGTHDRSHVISHYDALAQAGFLDQAAPTVALRFGAAPVSKATNDWLAAHPEVDLAVVDTTGWRDPGGTARAVVTADPTLTAQELAKLMSAAPAADWLQLWKEADAAAAAALTGEDARFSELTAVSAVLEALPGNATLWAASSMPIRQVDLLMPDAGDNLRLLANRGASGIDGFISSGMGSAIADPDPTYLLAGDLSLVHDLTALGFAGRHNVDVTIVVVNNDGGGIFHLLPQAELPEFEELFGTPHGIDFEAAAGLFGLRYTRAASATELSTAVQTAPSGPHLVEVRFDRAEGATAYRDAIARVAEAI
ncbi:MAG: 2-succinyl-5-enolpyruvyl-6-hydroxy-3-cyclohexene-1-carboxylic-acid synthase [Acidimicrobiia bacterium]